MLVFNEGVPRSGKSYDAVRSHILQALKKGRKVFARLNGLKHEAIAQYLQMRLADVQALLIHVPSEDVPRLHEMVEPGCLVVIDECHDFYVASAKALPTHVEKFFAEHGHYGMDIVLMSQFWKRLHVAVRARVERKTTFQKLTAVGMKGKYLATYYHTVAPDKFEKVGQKTESYDPAIFPLYDGYVPGVENTEVYEEGGVTVWRSVLPLFVVAAVLLVAGGWAYAHFFSTKAGTGKPATVTPVAPPKPAAGVAATGVPLAPKAPSTPVAPAKPKRPDMPAEASYIWDLSDKAKPRLVAMMGVDGGDFRAVVEWRADQSRVLERMTSEQIKAMGVMVQQRGYGLRLSWGEGKNEQVLIVTAWPVDEPNRYSQQQITNIRDAGPQVPGAGREPDVAASDVPGQTEKGWASGVGAPAYQPPGSMPWNSDPFGGGKGGR
jgi:zona occludens toxin